MRSGCAAGPAPEAPTGRGIAVFGIELTRLQFGAGRRCARAGPPVRAPRRRRRTAGRAIAQTGGRTILHGAGVPLTTPIPATLWLVKTRNIPKGLGSRETHARLTAVRAPSLAPNVE